MPSLLRLPQTALATALSSAIAPQQAMRRSQFAAVPPIEADVVFLGDSLTEYGLWSEWFLGRSVVNRGIGGDTSAGVLRRLDTSTGSQRKLSLLIGTNDLALGVRIPAIAANVGAIIDGIRRTAPATEIYLNGVLPRARRFRDRVRELNDALLAVADERTVVFLDLWPALADADGALRRDFTMDKLHLTGAGYRAWVGVLADHLG